MDAAMMLEQARAMLASNNLPINTANLNRAALALARGASTLEMEGEESRSAQRSVQSRTRSQGNQTAAAAPPRGEAQASAQQEMPMPPPATPMDDSGARMNMAVGGMDYIDPMRAAIDAQIEAGGMGSGVSPAETLPIEAAVIPRRGSMPRAQVIDEENPEAGMFAGAPPRQADETGVDPMGVANALGMPFTALLGAPIVASRAIPQLGVTLNRPMLAGPRANANPQLPGSAGMPQMSGPSAPPGLGGPGAQARLSAPQALLERARRRVSETAGRNRRDRMRND